jgi:hypothetical protein
MGRRRERAAFPTTVVPLPRPPLPITIRNKHNIIHNSSNNNIHIIRNRHHIIIRTKTIMATIMSIINHNNVIISIIITTTLLDQTRDDRHRALIINRVAAMREFCDRVE